MKADPIMVGITNAIDLLHSGDRAGARSRFEALWSSISKDPQPFHECVLSHYAADAQEDAKEELTWDLRALAAAERCTDEEAQRSGQSLSIAAFMPSLHLNLADDYRKIGILHHSLHHLALAQASLGNLDDDSYGRMIRRGIHSLAAKLEAM